MLFGGLCLGFGGGIGLLEILLIGAGLFLLFRFMSARRQQKPTYATAGAPYPSGDAYAGGSAYGRTPPPGAATPQVPAGGRGPHRRPGPHPPAGPAFRPRPL